MENPFMEVSLKEHFLYLCKFLVYKSVAVSILGRYIKPSIVDTAMNVENWQG